MSVSRKFSEKTAAMFSPEDQLVRAWIADPDGVPEETILTPNDYNAGGIGNLLEHLRGTALELRKQMLASEADPFWLTFILHELVGIPRFPSESDSEWLERVSAYLMAPKLSKAAIINHARRFSPNGEPTIRSDDNYGFFWNLSPWGGRRKFRNTAPGPKFEWWTFPALMTDTSDAAFTFVLELYGTDSADIPAIFEFMRRWTCPAIAFRVAILP